MLEVDVVANQGNLHEFVTFPWRIYQGDENWVPPIISQVKKRLDVHSNPYYQYAQRQLFLAVQGGETAGTIGAIINHKHNQQLGEKTGYFGFFETVDDQEVASRLLSTAGDWLREKGMTHMRGPINGSPTDEVGILIKGHHRRPAMWEGHTPAYYQGLVESQGFQKYDDVFAYEFTYDQIGRSLDNLPGKLERVARKALNDERVSIRSIDMQNWSGDIIDVHYIYNTAFRTIPGHTDMSLAYFRSLAEGVRPFLDRDLALMAEVDGKPVGFAVLLPDINEALCGFNGQISTTGKLKLWWRLRRIKTVCFKLMGVLPEYRGRGLEAAMASVAARRLVRKGYDRVELSLASEKNLPSNQLIRRMGGKLYRHYRIYERRL